MPYFDVQEKFPENIASLKITEAISVLRTIDKDIDHILANFEEPYKINLDDFMQNNFMFNMPLEKFAYLTGRSLTTFKRDFQKLYNQSPQRWLTRRRLELAYYQLVEKKENLSRCIWKQGLKIYLIFHLHLKNILGIRQLN